MEGDQGIWRRGLIAGGIMMAFAAPVALAAQGDPLGPPFLVTSINDNINYTPTVARSLGNGSLVAAWGSFTTPGNQAVRARRFSADGTPQGNDITVSELASGDAGEAAVAMDDDGDFVVAWTKGADLWARRYSADGVGSPAQLVGTGGDTIGAPSVAMDADGDFVVGWFDSKGVTNRKIGTTLGCYYGHLCFTVSAASATLRARRYSAQGLPLGNVAVVDSGGSVTVLGSESGTILRLPGHPLQLGQSARVAMAADGGYVVTWSRQSASDGFDTFTRHFSKYNVGDKSQLVSQGDSGPLNPVIAMAPSGAYALAYARNAGIYVQPFTAGSVKQGAELRADDGSYPAPGAPSVTMDKAGDFMVAWDDSAATEFRVPTSAPVRYFGSGGHPMSPIFQLALPGARPQDPVIASDAGGNLVGVWFDTTGDLSYTITGRLFSAH